MEEVWHLEHFSIEDAAVTSRDLDSKELEESDDLLIRRLHLLFEENEDKLVDFGDCLVDWGGCEVFEWLQWWLVDAVSGLVLSFMSLHGAVEGDSHVFTTDTKMTVTAFVA